MNPLQADTPAVTEFLKAWHEAEREALERSYDRLVYDDYAPKTAKERRKYLALDRGTSGVYLVDRITSEVYSIKAYGVPNRRLGTLSDLTAAFWERRATAANPLAYPALLAATRTEPDHA